MSLSFDFKYTSDIVYASYNFCYNSKKELLNEKSTNTLSIQKDIKKEKKMRFFSFLIREIHKDDLKLIFSFIIRDIKSVFEKRELELLSQKNIEHFDLTQIGNKTIRKLNDYLDLSELDLKDKKELKRDLDNELLEYLTDKEFNAFKDIPFEIHKISFLDIFTRIKDLNRVKEFEFIKRKSGNLIFDTKDNEFDSFDLRNLDKNEIKQIQKNSLNLIFEISIFKNIIEENTKILKNLNADKQFIKQKELESLDIVDKIFYDFDKTVDFDYERVYGLLKSNNRYLIRDIFKVLEEEKTLLFDSKYLDKEVFNDKNQNLLNRNEIKELKNNLKEYFVDQEHVKKISKEEEMFLLFLGWSRRLLKEKTNIKLFRKFFVDMQENCVIKNTSKKEFDINKMYKRFLDRKKIKDNVIKRNSIRLKRNINKDICIEKDLKMFVYGVLKELTIDNLEKFLKIEIIREIIKDSLVGFDSKKSYEILKNDECKLLLSEKIKELFKEYNEILLTKINKKQIENIFKSLKLDKEHIPNVSIEDNKALLEKVYKIFFEQKNNLVDKKIMNFVNELPNLMSMNKEILKEDANIISKDLNLQNYKSDKDMPLFRRFWFLDNMKLDGGYGDLMILPQEDYPYEKDPIKEGGFVVCDNWNVVYPHSFYNKIDKHPIPFGKDLGRKEVEVYLKILVDIINIFIMLWAKFERAFWGWTGTQACIGMANAVYNWIMLETSKEEMRRNNVEDQYRRVYQWIRWECEKMSLKARNDGELKANYYIELLLKELFLYMQDHHFDTTPIFKNVEKMDEYRNTLYDVHNDINFVIDKVKGIRHIMLEREG